MEEKFFHHRIKRTNGTYEKGIEVHDSIEAAKQAYHAYLGAYAYGHNQGTDFVSCMITGMDGMERMSETWRAPEPEEA